MMRQPWALIRSAVRYKRNTVMFGGQRLILVMLPQVSSMRAAHVGYGRCRLCLGYAPHPTPSRHRCRPARCTVAPPKRPRHRYRGIENQRNTPEHRRGTNDEKMWTNNHSNHNKKYTILDCYCFYCVIICNYNNPKYLISRKINTILVIT